jgi:hypothetical protein
MTIMKSRPVTAALIALVALATAFGATSYFAPNPFADVPSIAKTVEYQDQALLARAWVLPVAATYKSEFDYQSNASFCGPTSVVDVMRSMGRRETQDTVLDGSDVWTLFGYVVPAGMTLDELTALMRLKTGAPVKVLRDLDLAAFRAELPHFNDISRRYVINFSRGPLFGRGHGHHSPILGYLADEDLIFIGDVNRDFGPWLVKPERLFEAMNTLDDSSSKKRGLLVVALSNTNR